MKRQTIKNVLFALAGLTLLPALVLGVYLHIRPKGGEAPALPYAEMRDGDLAFRMGTGTYSRFINIGRDAVQYSHIGVLVRDEGVWCVVHAVPGETEGAGDFERVKKERVERFFGPDRATHGELVHTGLEDTEALVEQALSWAADSVRFDGDFDLEDDSRLYCTELVYRLYLARGVDLSEGRRSYIGVPLLSRPEGVIAPEDLRQYYQNKTYFFY